MSTQQTTLDQNQRVPAQNQQKQEMPSYAKPLALFILGLAVIGVAMYIGIPNNISCDTITVVSTAGIGLGIVGIGLLLFKKDAIAAKVALLAIGVMGLGLLLTNGIRYGGILYTGQYLESFKAGLHNLDWQQWVYPVGAHLGYALAVVGIFYLVKTRYERDQMQDPQNFRRTV